MNRRRLLHTARQVLPFVEPDEFDMTDWTCGTASCAFGHECLSDYGKQNGLRLTRLTNYTPRFGDNLYGYPAARAYYDLDDEAVRWIFSSLQYPRDRSVMPAEVAERIESLLASES